MATVFRGPVVVNPRGKPSTAHLDAQGAVRNDLLLGGGGAPIGQQLTDLVPGGKPFPMENRGYLDPMETWLLRDQFFGAAGQPPLTLAWPIPGGKPFPLENRTFVDATEIWLLKDQFFGAAGQPPQAPLLPNPAHLRRPIDLGIWAPSLLATLLAATGTPAPFVPLDLALPLTPRPLALAHRTHIGYYVPDNSAPFLQTEWPLPVGKRAITDLTTWNAAASLGLLASAVPMNALYDWPLPTGRAALRDLRTFLASPLLGLNAGAAPVPGQTDWLLPRVKGVLRDLFTLWNPMLQSAGTPPPSPFSVTDWPLPSAKPTSRELRTWLTDVSLTLLGQDAMLPPLPLWTIPTGKAWPLDLRTFLQSSLATVPPLPGALLDWPVPMGRPTARELRTLLQSLALNLQGQDALPFRQSDWPLPLARASAAHLRNLVVGFFFAGSAPAAPTGLRLHAAGLDMFTSPDGGLDALRIAPAGLDSLVAAILAGLDDVI